MNSLFLKNIFPVLLVLLLSIPAILPLFREGFFPVHDNTQVQRVYEMGKALGDGMIPVRWSENLGYGYGYPIFNFYAPLAYYFGGLFTLIGISALGATKIMFAAGVLLSGISMYLLGRKLWGEIGGVVSGVFYMYAPYHALNIYVRGDVGEFWSYSFIPLIFLSLFMVYEKKNYRYVVVGGLSYAGVVLSHNLTAFMLTPFMILATTPFFYKFYKEKDLKLFLGPFLIFVLGVFLSAFYWLPALAELKFTNVASIIGGGSDFRDHFVCVNQLWSGIWAFGGSDPGCMDGISFKIGKVHVLGVLASAFLLILAFRKGLKSQVSVALLVLGALFVSIFLVLGVSKPLWEILKPMEFIQFPWRFLSLISFFASLLSGSIIYFVRRKEFAAALGIILVAGVMVVNTKLFVPQKRLVYPASSYVSGQAIKWDTSKISDEYMPSDFPFPESIVDLPQSIVEEKDGVSTKLIRSKTQEHELSVTADQSTNLVFNIAYFPSWSGFIDDEVVRPKSFNGKISVEIPKGDHIIRLKFIQTQVERAGNLISVASIVLLITGIILGMKRKYFRYEKS